MRSRIFSCSNVPILQNRVYESAEAAQLAKTGELDICLQDSFAWNASFDEALINYDQNYNNSVPSAVFEAYYDRIANYLASRYDISSGPVVEIGCGKGTFLKRMATSHRFDGVGIDPSYEGPAQIGNLRFITEAFDKNTIELKPSLVICRHTLEHIPEPTKFLQAIIEAFPAGFKFPVFCEVPDLTWIIQQRSWWDFCYEHVNYFTATSFARCLQNAGCGSVRITTEFNDQYLWAEGIANAPGTEAAKSEAIPDRLPDMNSAIDDMIKEVTNLAASRTLVIWGMATKGVMYALQALNRGVEIGYGVDINTEKQGKFAPVSGLRISAPEELPADNQYAIICMNPNYKSEITAHLERLKLDYVLITP